MELQFDVFISYATGQSTPICEKLVEHLESTGLKCWMAPRNILASVSWDEAILDGIESSALVVVLCDQKADQSGYVKREVALANETGKTVLPVRLDEFPLRGLRFLLLMHHWFEAAKGDFENHLPRLTNDIYTLLRKVNPTAPPPQPVVPRTPPPVAAGPTDAAPSAAPAPSGGAGGKHVAILYRRNSEPDERLLRMIEDGLRARGATVFIDRHLAVGVEWAREIERQIRDADAVIPLLSANAVDSEMIRYEINIAHEAAQEQNGRPRLLPVRIAHDAPLPGEIARIIDPIEWFPWNGPKDDAGLIEALVQAVIDPVRPVLEMERKVATTDGAVLPLSSQYYVERSVDHGLADALARRDSIVLIKGARQMGKTSLLARGLRQARQSNFDVVATDFQKLSPDLFNSAKELYLELSNMIADQLDIDELPEDNWNERRPPNVNFERYLSRKVLKERERHLVWAIDEADRLFPHAVSSELFGLFRSWHNARALDPEAPWSGLTMVIAYATEAHLFIADLNQSPFNVGTRFVLADFSLEEIQDLNKRYGEPIRDERSLARFHLLVGGQPFLTHRGLQELANGLSLPELERRAADDQGPFGDHLRRMLVLLAKEEGLLAAMRDVLDGRPCPNETLFYRLRSGGLLQGDSAKSTDIRCDIYAAYLRKHLQ
jgi:hypothetical protein